jgi:GT2 family glycosyltransferase
MLSFLIPFRDPSGDRTQAHQWMLARWRHHYPEAEFCIGSDDGVDPFNKSLAVNNAAKQASGDIYLILDADCWVEPQYVERAIAMVERGVPWVVPCRRNMRLRRDVSEKLMARDPAAPLPPILTRDAEVTGPVVGFLHVLSRQNFELVGGMDERIRGWGGEDTAFTWALDRVIGHHAKLNGIALCLWHERPRDTHQQRTWFGQDRRSEAYKKALIGRYTHARSKEAMLALLSEERELPPVPVYIPSLAARATPRKFSWLEVRERRRVAQ